jgi:hypothetical protein
MRRESALQYRRQSALWIAFSTGFFAVASREELRAVLSPASDNSDSSVIG